MRLPRLTIRRLMVAVASIALIVADARVAVPLILAGFGVVFLLRERSPRPYFITLACLYLPFSWLVLMAYPWDGYRWGWIKLWPILPGLPAGLFLHPNDRAMFLASGLAALAQVALFTKLGSQSRRSLIITNAIALVVALLESFLAYQLFLL